MTPDQNRAPNKVEVQTSRVLVFPSRASVGVLCIPPCYRFSFSIQYLDYNVAFFAPWALTDATLLAKPARPRRPDRAVDRRHMVMERCNPTMAARVQQKSDHALDDSTECARLASATS